MKAYHGSAVLKFDDTVTGNAGVSVPVTVRVNSNQALAALFDLDDAPAANPVTTDNNGNYSFKTTDNIYDIIISEGTGGEVRLQKVEIAEIPTIPILINDLSQAYEFTTVAEYETFETVFPDGKQIKLLDRGAIFTKVNGAVTPNGFNIIGGVSAFQTIELSLQDNKAYARQWGYTPDYRLANGDINPTPTSNNAQLNSIFQLIPENTALIIEEESEGYLTGGVTVPKNKQIIMNSPLWTNDFLSTAIYIDNEGAQSYKRYRIDIRNENFAAPTWSSSTQIGVQIRNIFEAHFEIVAAWGFYKNIMIVGDGSALGGNGGVSHCTFDLGLIYNCKWGVNLHSVEFDDYVNQNVFNQGQFITDSGLNLDKDKYGVVLSSDSDYQHNSNEFNNPSFEIRGDGVADNVHVWCQVGRSNNFNNVRSESSNTTAMLKASGGSFRNILTYVFTNTSNNIDDTSLYTSNIVKSILSDAYKYNVVNYGTFARHIREPSVGEFSLLNFDFFRSASPTPGSYWSNVGELSLDGQAALIKSGNAMGLLLNTQDEKKLFIDIVFDTGQGGRVLCTGFDEDLNPVVDLSGYRTVPAQSISPVGAGFGGNAFSNGVNSDRIIYELAVPQEVKYLWVGAYATGGTARLTSMVISAPEQIGVGTWTNRVDFYALATPTLTAPTAIAGDRFMRVSRQSAQNAGWYFTTDGGWVTFT